MNNKQNVPFVKDILILLAGIGVFTLAILCATDSSIVESTEGKIATYITGVLGFILLIYGCTFQNMKEYKLQKVKSV